ncbi:polysaccharide biosynthesis C-terminal domain-containing protein [Ferrimonas lipolytica]|nr:lipopolysaccharide biosynthesis protein [Ferrimonas lipolytica]
MQFLLMPAASHFLSIPEYAQLTIFLALLTALVPMVSLSSESAYAIFYNQELGLNKKRLFIDSVHVATTGLIIFSFVNILLSLIDDNLLFSVVSLKYQMTKMLLIVFFEYFMNLYLLSNRLNFDKVGYFCWFILFFAVKFFVGLGAIYLFESSDAYLNSILLLNFTFFIIIVSRVFGLVGFFGEVFLFNRDSYVRLIKYSTIILPVSIFSVINSMIDKIYITSLLPLKELANYTSVFLLAGAIQVVILAMNKSYMPSLLKLYSLHGYLSLDKIKNRTKSLMLVSYLFFIFCIIILPFVFKYIYSDKIEFSYNVFVVLSLSFLFNTLYILYTNVLSLEEQTAKYKMFGFISATILNVPLSYILTLKFGILGAALSTMLSCIFAASILYSLVNRRVKRHYLLKDSLIFVFVASTTAIFFVVLNTQIKIF